MLFFLVIGAMLLSVSISAIGVPRAIVLMLGELPLTTTQILLLIWCMYLIMGCFIDGMSMMVSTLPFVVPALHALGVDFVWFGVAFIMIQEVGLVTPPVGLNLFVIQGIAGPKTAISDVALGSLPFLLITVGVVLLVTGYQDIVLFLPRLLGLY